MHKYGVEVVDVCNKYVLHGFERADRERPQEVGVHCACDDKTKHVVGGADFFAWL